jgi:hypothetical protein
VTGRALGRERVTASSSFLRVPPASPAHPPLTSLSFGVLPPSRHPPASSPRRPTSPPRRPPAAEAGMSPRRVATHHQVPVATHPDLLYIAEKLTGLPSPPPPPKPQNPNLIGAPPPPPPLIHWAVRGQCPHHRLAPRRSTPSLCHRRQSPSDNF